MSDKTTEERLERIERELGLYEQDRRGEMEKIADWNNLTLNRVEECETRGGTEYVGVFSTADNDVSQLTAFSKDDHISSEVQMNDGEFEVIVWGRD